ncbi:MAG: redoxin domain-containing protein [Thermoplasmata archaeon]|nr:MAG: redoxin domain-containing protein [Thermoplasmata archaeon]
MRKIILSLVTGWILVSAALFSLCVFSSEKEINASADEWGDAPDFTLRDIEDNLFTLSDNLGKVILIDFMATWCGPCHTEMEELDKIHDEVGNGIVMISIDVDTSETEEDVVNSFEDYVFKWIFAIDTNSEGVSNQYEIQYIPTIYIIDTNGDISYSSTGITEEDTLMDELEEAGYKKSSEGAGGSGGDLMPFILIGIIAIIAVLGLIFALVLLPKSGGAPQYPPQYQQQYQSTQPQYTQQYQQTPSQYPQQQIATYCPYCGNLIQPGWQVCTYCKNPL